MLLEQILPNCALHSNRVNGDDRGSLIAIEAEREVPFKIERVYFVYDTQPGVERGFHAHKSLEQWMICVTGSCVIVVDDGHSRHEALLDSPEKALYVGPGLWREMRDFSPGAVLAVIASTKYDVTDYIRDYNDFLAFVRGGPA